MRIRRTQGFTIQLSRNIKIIQIGCMSGHDILGIDSRGIFTNMTIVRLNHITVIHFLICTHFEGPP